MILDANLLLYAKVADFAQHELAREWLDHVLAGPRRVGLPWPSLLAFIRLVTHPRIFASPLMTREAWEQVEIWLNAPAAWIPAPGPGHREILGRLLMETQTFGSLVSDAHLAALAIEHDTALLSTDGDFRRFKGLTWRDPLRPSR